MLKKYTTSKLHKYNSIVYTVEPVRTNLKLNKKVRNEYYIEVLIYLTFIYLYSLIKGWQKEGQAEKIDAACCFMDKPNLAKESAAALYGM